MKHAAALAAVLARAAYGSPVPVPQGVTEILEPSGTAPVGCKPTFPGEFGITVVKLNSTEKAKRDLPINQIGDGQIQNLFSFLLPFPTPVLSQEVPQVTEIGDGQPQVPTNPKGPPFPVKQIGDGQIQFHNVSTVSRVPAPAPISVQVPQVTVIGDGQPQAPVLAKRQDPPPDDFDIDYLLLVSQRCVGMYSLWNDLQNCMHEQEIPGFKKRDQQTLGFEKRDHDPEDADDWDDAKDVITDCVYEGETQIKMSDCLSRAMRLRNDRPHSKRNAVPDDIEDAAEDVAEAIEDCFESDSTPEEINACLEDELARRDSPLLSQDGEMDLVERDNWNRALRFYFACRDDDYEFGNLQSCYAAHFELNSTLPMIKRDYDAQDVDDWDDGQDFLLSCREANYKVSELKECYRANVLADLRFGARAADNDPEDVDDVDDLFDFFAMCRQQNYLFAEAEACYHNNLQRREVPVSQIFDGQIQNGDATAAVSSIPAKVSSQVPQVTVIGDGQPQAPAFAKRADRPEDIIYDYDTLVVYTDKCLNKGYSINESIHCIGQYARGEDVPDRRDADPSTFGLSKRAEADTPVTQIADGQIQNPPAAITAPLPALLSRLVVPQVTVIGDGQPQAPVVTAAPPAPAAILSSQVPHVTAIGDGQPQAPVRRRRRDAPVSQIADGQIQNPSAATAAPPAPAVKSSLVPQVTVIGDGQPQAPAASAAPPAPPAAQPSQVDHVTAIGDGQPQAPNRRRDAPVSQIADGQIQNPSAIAGILPSIVSRFLVPQVTVIGDGQPQAPPAATAAPPAPPAVVSSQVLHVTAIGDGQPQAPVRRRDAPVSQIGDGQIQNPSAAPAAPPAPPAIKSSQVPQVTVIGDGQPQAPPAASAAPPSPAAPTSFLVPHVTAIGDGQPQAPIGKARRRRDVPVSQIADGQIQNPAATAAPAASAAPVASVAPSAVQSCQVPQVTVIGDGQPQAPAQALERRQSSECDGLFGSRLAARGDGDNGPAPSLYSCSVPGSLRLWLTGGTLKDEYGRTGYIADNRQFQFDAPPQTGAIITHGFSVCADGRLGLGGSTTWFQCASGDFYNLYDRDWAEHCEAVELHVVELSDCNA